MIEPENRYCVRCLESDPPALGRLLGNDEICEKCAGYAQYAHDAISGRILLGFQKLLEKEDEGLAGGSRGPWDDSIGNML